MSPAINDVAKNQREAPVKEPAQNEIVPNQIYEPNLLTDQESGAIETAKHVEQLTEAEYSKVKFKVEPVKDNLSPLLEYGTDIDKTAQQVVDEAIEQEEEFEQSFPGINSSLQ